MRDIFYCICRYGANRRRLQSEIWCISIRLDISTLCPSVYPCFDVSIAMSGPQRRKYSRIRYADIQQGMTQRAANFDVNGLVLWMNFYASRTIGFWMSGRKSHCEGFILAEFSTFQRCISFSMVVLHILNLPRLIASFEEAKLLWSFGLVRKAELIEVSWVFMSFLGWDLEKTGFCFYKSFFSFLQILNNSDEHV